MRPFILPISESQRIRLLEEARRLRGSWTTFAPYLLRVADELVSADLTIARPGMATIGRLVWLRVEPDNRTERWVLVMPDEADDDAGQLSALSPLGWAILGARAGDRLMVPSEEGFDRYVVERVDDLDESEPAAIEELPDEPEPAWTGATRYWG
jgi:regulator of nucleoside diphosphate kinase